MKLWACSCSSVMYSVRGLGGMALSLLMTAEDWGLGRSDEQGFVGQVGTGFGKKLLCSQKSEFIFSSVEPDLVSRSED